MSSRRLRRARRRRARLIASGALALVIALAASAAFVAASGREAPGDDLRAQTSGLVIDPVATTVAPAPTTTTVPRYSGWVDPASAFAPYPRASVTGLLTFRGNPTRTWHGLGPMPAAPREVWRYPGQKMCSLSKEFEEVTNWCGTGWTGQPAVFERDGRTWLVFGAYDRAVHFVDAVTGIDILPPFVTGDLIKSSVTVDPEGYPIVYFGSRDNYLRAIAFDGGSARELWRLDAHAVRPTLWNDDWDGSPLIVDDYLFEGGENSQFHVVKLNRGYGAGGIVTMAPELVFNTPGWDEELLRAVGGEVSIEGSVAISGNVVYFANSGGLVQGWDIGPLRAGTGQPQRVFRFWTGDDSDGTIAVDEAGMLYVGSEWERHTPRSREVGQMMKLDPSRPDNPVVWSQTDDAIARAGIYSSAAVVGDVVVFSTYSGRLVGLDRATGAIRWQKRLPSPLMGSPVVVDGVLLQGDCGGVMHAYDARNTAVDPPELWQVRLGSCIESTPAVWRGRVYVGTRGGFVHAVGDA
jgi:outer membrane protein assembly factor BamB